VIAFLARAIAALERIAVALEALLDRERGKS